MGDIGYIFGLYGFLILFIGILIGICISILLYRYINKN